jgi:hypothetical protein
MENQRLKIVDTKALSAWLKRKARSPLWQPFGVGVAILAIFIGYFIGSRSQPPGPNRLVISPESAKELIEFPGSVSRRTKVLIDGKEERDLRLFVFRIQYKGNRPLVSGDFEGPLRGEVPAGRRLLAVQRASNLEGKSEFDSASGHYVKDTSKPIETEPRVVDLQHFEVKPVLMNPGEWFGIEIYTSSNNDPTSSPTPELSSSDKYSLLAREVTWGCHVAGVKCPSSLDIELDFPQYAHAPWFLEVHLIHRAWGVYALLFFSTVNLLLLVGLSKRTRLGGFRLPTQLGLLAIAVPLSFSTGEILTYKLVTQYPISMEQEWGVYVVAGVDLLILVDLATVVVKQKLKERTQRLRGTKHGNH